VQTSAVPDFDSMAAGEEMDLLVAVTVLGAARSAFRESPGDISRGAPPPYSTLDAAAIGMIHQAAANHVWTGMVEFNYGQTPQFVARISGETASAQTLPLALCRAALKAVAQ
jgi:hypothetical protein